MNLLDGGQIGRAAEPERVTLTGLDDIAVIHVPNTTTSRQLHGIDDYVDIDSIVSEIEVRLDQIAKVLDKHTACLLYTSRRNRRGADRQAAAAMQRGGV